MCGCRNILWGLPRRAGLALQYAASLLATSGWLCAVCCSMLCSALLRGCVPFGGEQQRMMQASACLTSPRSVPAALQRHTTSVMAAASCCAPHASGRQQLRLLVVRVSASCVADWVSSVPLGFWTVSGAFFLLLLWPWHRVMRVCAAMFRFRFELCCATVGLGSRGYDRPSGSGCAGVWSDGRSPALALAAMDRRLRAFCSMLACVRCGRA